MSDLVQTRGHNKRCPDDECRGIAEAEVDGQHRYWECLSCGFQFDYEQIVAPDGNCAIGVPEQVRRQFSVGEPETPAVPVQLGRRKSV